MSVKHVICGSHAAYSLIPGRLCRFLCVDPSSNARGRICKCFTESPAPILKLQVSSLLDKLVKRDSKLKLPVLEELCLAGCLTTDEAIEDWSRICGSPPQMCSLPEQVLPFCDLPQEAAYSPGKLHICGGEPQILCDLSTQSCLFASDGESGCHGLHKCSNLTH